MLLFTNPHEEFSDLRVRMNHSSFKQYFFTHCKSYWKKVDAVNKYRCFRYWKTQTYDFSFSKINRFVPSMYYTINQSKIKEGF